MSELGENGGNAADTADEVEALRVKVSDLEGQLQSRTPNASAAASTPARGGWWRTVVVICLVILASLIAPLSVIANWAHDEIGDTDRYVETVTPLASDPAVQKAVADRISEEIFVYVDVREITSDALTALAQQDFVPPRAATVLPSLSVPLSTAIENFVSERVDRVVQSEAFETAWVVANRRAHARMVDVLSGDNSGAVRVTDGAVTVNIADFVAATKQRLLSDGFSFASRIPEVNATFTIFQAKNVGTAQKAYSWLDTLARILPILGILCLVIAVMISRNRRKTLLAAGLSIAASMVLLGLGLNLVRPIYLDAIPADVLPTDAAAAIYDTLVAFIRTALRAVGIVALAVALAAFWFAPTGAGKAIRSGATAQLTRLRGRATGAGMNTGPVGTFLSTYRAFTRVVVTSIGALAYLSLDHPTGANAAVIIGSVVLVLIIVEFLASPARRTTESP